MKHDHWTTWFISDPHFGHSNCIGFCDRPFKNVKEMDEKIIENWNKLIKPQDLVIVVGDVFFHHSKEQMKAVMSRLNGKKILVRGNHDFKARIMMNVGFELCVYRIVMDIANERVLICHYPYQMNKKLYKWIQIKSFFRKLVGLRGYKMEKYHDRRPRDEGGFLIHGHTHSKEKFNGKEIHVGVDAWNFKPINIQEISNYISKIKEGEKKK